MNDETISGLEQRTSDFSSLPVIEGYYLVLGGGKIGNDFAEYAKKNAFPFVIIIDIDETAEASNSSISVSREKLSDLII